MRRLVFSILLAGMAAQAPAQNIVVDKRLPQMILDELQVTDESLAQCRYKDGRAIDAVSCKRWTAALAQARADIDASERKAELLRRETYEANKAMQEDLAERERKRQAANEAAAASRKAEQERQRAAEAEASARRAAEDAADEAREAAIKKACGKDYMAPRIGMPIKRALQCLGGFNLVRQVNRKDGVLSTYVSTDGQAWLHELGGRVVAWGQD